MLPLLLAAAALPFIVARPTSLTRRQETTCPTAADSPLSCPSPAGVDSCCTITPGGQLLQTQFWDYDPATGPSDSFTIHGLWPDHCDGTFDANCDASREVGSVRSILQAEGKTDLLAYMDTYWKDYNGDDDSFWVHENNKHFTCVSTLACIPDVNQAVVAGFERTVSLFKTLPTYQWLADAGIVPSTSATYTLDQLQAVAKDRFGYEATWGCKGSNLNQVFYGYVVRGTYQDGDFIATGPDGDKSSCPAIGIRFLPKGTSSTPTATGSTAPPGSTSTGAPAGKVFMNVIFNGAETGCLISTGKWMVGSTCAGYTVAQNGFYYTLKTSKGFCGIVSGVFTCGSAVSAQSFSTDADGNLVFGTNDQFYGSAVPSGSQQVQVVTGQAAKAIKLRPSA